jgi:hypothetical protein
MMLDFGLLMTSNSEEDRNTNLRILLWRELNSVNLMGTDYRFMRLIMTGSIGLVRIIKTG